MNVAIIYGTNTKDNTYNCVKLLLKKIKLNTDISVTEFFIPDNSSHLYSGSVSCFINAQYKSHHRNNIYDIVNALDQSDLIILASPVCSCDVSVQMKLFLNNLLCNLQNYEFNSKMGDKVGIVISTASGAGLNNTLRTLQKSLKLLGIKKILRFSKTLYELDWLDINFRNKIKLSNKTSKLAYRATKLTTNTSFKRNHIFTFRTFPHLNSTQNKKAETVIKFPNQRSNKYANTNIYI
ncbi:NAD(P)H-dependent oxidoreductase [Clostridium saccharobutylicum]|uniref:NADPH-dependent FMN reductase n=1 Tax=Clostridium saccharobutylicum TaxID=169679 RepID=A0A1S8NJ41_CLOSA|nr:NAD(P)H-dependent oxidoreductase [Clostridium saccharobutylicum]OOM16470.1 NADPH-dependent FMN reductase [Clostridium saccharobutylicum]